MLASVLDPLYTLMAYILAGIYSVIPNYAVAIFGLTLIVLAILTPLTLKGLRSTIKIQKLMPEQKRLQAQFKDDRQALNEAIMAMYKENKVSPVGGCLPFIVQSPFFIALFGVLRGMSRVRRYPASVAGKPYGEWGPSLKIGRGKAGPADAIRYGDPQHVPQGSKLDHSLRGMSADQWYESSGLKRLGHRPGEVKSLGFDLAKSASEMASKGFVKFLPYVLLIVLMVGLQIFAQRQVNQRNPAAAAANPQMQTITKVMPFMFGVFGWTFQAGLTLYWTTSSALRIVQQWALYRFDPTLAESVKEKKADLAREAAGEAKKRVGKGAPDKASAKAKALPGGGASKAGPNGKAKPGKATPGKATPAGGGASSPPNKRRKPGGPAAKPDAKPAPKPNLGIPPKPVTDGPKGGANGSVGGPSRPTPGRQQPKKRRKGR